MSNFFVFCILNVFFSPINAFEGAVLFCAEVSFSGAGPAFSTSIVTETSDILSSAAEDSSADDETKSSQRFLSELLLKMCV